jgi:FlaA1/EpsC-like NDP-sugar epimerase
VSASRAAGVGSLAAGNYRPVSASLLDLASQLQRLLVRALRAVSARRDVFFLAGDAASAVAATLAVCFLSQGRAFFMPSSALLLGGLAAVLAVLANLAFNNYRLAWVTFSLADLRRLFGAVVLVTLTLTALSPLPFMSRLNAPDPALWGMTLFLAAAAFRGSKRLIAEPLANAPGGKRTLVVMSSRHAYFLPGLLRRIGNFNYAIEGIVDPDPGMVGNHEQGVEVLGTTGDIEAIVERYRIEAVLVLLESDPGFGLGDLYARLHRLGNVEVKTMPSLVDVIEDRSDIGALERLSIHELTGQPPVPIDVRQMRRVFAGRRVLITGAGGSIGSELCRQLARFSPSRLVLFERDDSNLFYADRELRARYPGVDTVPFLGDIMAQRDLERAFAANRPEVVFHAAAYKHVPILEFHPDDAVAVNASGTLRVAQAAAAAGTECFVYISTDKAVNPTSVMGASKRLGEMLAIALNGSGGMRVTAVRFGNVLDSRGSVSTIFRDAIARRQPLTVTDRDMRRYFMLTSEAVLLVLQAAALGQGGEVFVLDMGNPVRVWDLAHRMVELAGLTPNVDIPIVVTGARPGEKLFEELLTAEEGTVATSNDRIRRARQTQSLAAADMLSSLAELEQSLAGLAPADIKQRLRRFVPSYHPDECVGLRSSCHLAVPKAA